VELVLEAVSGATRAGAERVTTLDHEAGDHPVEDRAGVERLGRGLPGARVGPVLAALSQLDEVAHGRRRVVGKEPDLDIAVVRANGGVQLLSHGQPLVAGLVARG
jgi:hypothetical protein